ncbi:helicase-related protein [Acanthopleuribacter pedis]|uniref:Uncharacterized protein n=1 Tax=Acanthopleuribacter pedis TaxID=442870 RepID=A0A8J7U6F6_9BACT|nr:helicase-related protein [Acanthopleuribacter pedis]MBO1320316.1 hypothetical protein [Acanthopleuribacter pedis]
MSKSKSSASRKKASKKNRQRGIQAYYTNYNLSAALSSLIESKAITKNLKSVLDPAGGIGHLLQGVREGFHYANPDLSMIEPFPPYSDDKPFSRLKRNIGYYQMSFEEWCITYAEKEKYDLVFSNPPFNKRLGFSDLGEDLSSLFLPDLQFFESLFFLASSRIAKHYMAFIVPNSYFSKDEAKGVMHHLALSGWNLSDIRALPLDACYNALEEMSFLFFDRQPVKNWPSLALELIKSNNVQPLFEKVVITTEQGAHGPKFGYLLPKKTGKGKLSENLETIVSFQPCDEYQADFQPTFSFDWQPQPKAIGELWNRKGTVYELGEHGWVPANSQGYADGLPVNQQFDTAKKAFSYLQRGALYTAYHLLANIDLEGLRAQYKKIAAASFLSLLKKGPVVQSPMVKDLETLGMLACDEQAFAVSHPDIQRIGQYLVHRRTLSDAQACELYLCIDHEVLPQWVHEQTLTATRNQYIPADKLTLRSPWIPRQIIADVLGYKLDKKGLFVGDNRSIVRYLNYGKDGSIINENDQEVFELWSQHFAVRVNNHDSIASKLNRTKIHAHYLVHNAPKQRVQEAFQPINAALPLHQWQVDDVDFYLSGATISNLDVGLGKTLTALRAAVAHCTTGAKAIITVPKQVLSKWGATLERFFPGIAWANLGFRTNSKGKLTRLPRTELTEEAKKLFFDPAIQIILTSHQVFGEFKVTDADKLQADMENAFDQLGADTNPTAVKARAVFIKQAGQRTYHNGGEITFSDLPKGLLVVVDEAHNYKGLFGMPYSGWGESLIMAGQCGESRRAYDMQVKLDIVRARGGKTLALTATVINNSVAEIYNMLRVFAPQALKHRGIKNTQQLMDYFCTIEPITTVSLTGQVKQGQTITGFRNVDALQRMWDSCMISKTAQDVNLPLPAYQEIIERVEPTEAIKEYMDHWKSMLDKLIKKGDIEGFCHGADDAEEDKDTVETVGMLRIIGMLDKVACFPPQCGIKSNPKFDQVARNVLQHYQSHEGQQIIFADQKDVQQALSDRLVAQGVPLEQIVIINADTAPDASDRLAIQEAFNRGEYRVAIGGKVISEGIDLQENTIAAHFVNLAWEGGTIHQRKGRLIRQGNRNDRVFVYYYLLSGSTDDYRFLTISNKTHWGDALRKTQSNTLDQGVFSDPLDDEFLCALALNPAEIREVLRERRRDKELVKQANKAEKLFRTLLQFANPQTRTTALEIMQRYEAKLKKLEFLPENLVSEGIQRVQALAFLHDARIKDRARFKNWTRWVKDDTALTSFNEVSYMGDSTDAFTINVDGDGLMSWHFPELGGYLKPELFKTLPTFPETFGDVCPARDQPTIFAPASSGPSLKLVVIDTESRATGTNGDQAAALEASKAHPAALTEQIGAVVPAVEVTAPAEQQVEPTEKPELIGAAVPAVEVTETAKQQVEPAEKPELIGAAAPAIEVTEPAKQQVEPTEKPTLIGSVHRPEKKVVMAQQEPTPAKLPKEVKPCAAKVNATAEKEAKPVAPRKKSSAKLRLVEEPARVEQETPKGASGNRAVSKLRLVPAPPQPVKNTATAAQSVAASKKRAFAPKPVVVASQLPQKPKTKTKTKPKQAKRKPKEAKSMTFASESQPCLFDEQELIAATINPNIIPFPNAAKRSPFFGHMA